MSATVAVSIEDHLAELKSMLLEIRGMLTGPKPTREYYTTEDEAALLGRSHYTIRGWAREGCFHATKRSEKRGGAELWSIASAELDRYRNEGLLPLPKTRNL